MESLKLKYNSLLTRYYSAETYLDRLDISNEQKEFSLPEFKKIIEQLEQILIDLKNSGINATKTEILEGFYIEEA